jgi:hypothetical protein
VGDHRVPVILGVVPHLGAVVMEQPNADLAGSQSDAAAAPSADPRSLPAHELNQCDGCRRGLPVNGGLHRGGGYDLMACTSDRYGAAPSGGVGR